MPMRAYGILQPPTRHQQQEYLGAAVGAVPRLVQTGMPMPCMHARPSHRPRVQGASERAGHTPETRHESPTARSVAVLVVRSSRASIRVSGRRARGADAAEGGWMGESAAAAAAGGKTRRQTRDARRRRQWHRVGCGMCMCGGAHPASGRGKGVWSCGQSRMRAASQSRVVAAPSDGRWWWWWRRGEAVRRLSFFSFLFVARRRGGGRRWCQNRGHHHLHHHHYQRIPHPSIHPSIHPSSPCLALPRRSRNLSDAVQDASPLLQTTIQPTHAPPE